VSDLETVDLTDHELTELITLLHISDELAMRVHSRLMKRMIGLRVYERPPEIRKLAEQVFEGVKKTGHVHDELARIFNARLDAAEESED
jgi:hypothetical protein